MSATRAKPGPKPRVIVEHPEPLWIDWTDPTDLAAALTLHIARHGETVCHLARAIPAGGIPLDRIVLGKWLAGMSSPRSVASLEALGRIEHRYRLTPGSLRAKLPHPARANIGNALDDISRAERRPPADRRVNGLEERTSEGDHGVRTDDKAGEDCAGGPLSGVRPLARSLPPSLS